MPDDVGKPSRGTDQLVLAQHADQQDGEQIKYIFFKPVSFIVKDCSEILGSIIVKDN